MGTHAVIRLEQDNGKDFFAELYVHWDGYPEHMLPWLEEFNLKFTEERGNDEHYKFAQLLRFSSANGEKFNLDPSAYTGYGVGRVGQFTFVEYVYTLKADGLVSYVDGWTKPKV